MKTISATRRAPSPQKFPRAFPLDSFLFDTIPSTGCTGCTGCSFLSAIRAPLDPLDVSLSGEAPWRGKCCTTFNVHLSLLEHVAEIECHDSSQFRQKAETEGLKQLGSSGPNVYCIGVLYGDKTLKNANAKKDLMWFKCLSVSLSAHVHLPNAQHSPLAEHNNRFHLDSLRKLRRTSSKSRSSIQRLHTGVD